MVSIMTLLIEEKVTQPILEIILQQLVQAEKVFVFCYQLQCSCKILVLGEFRKSVYSLHYPQLSTYVNYYLSGSILLACCFIDTKLCWKAGAIDL